MLGNAMDDATKFQRLVQFRVPEALYDAINKAAHRDFMTLSGFLRQAAIEKCRPAGGSNEEAQAL
jgi:uncharacterized protein (DUF1778 family)